MVTKATNNLQDMTNTIGVRADIIINMKTIAISDDALFQVRYRLILFSHGSIRGALGTIRLLLDMKTLKVAALHTDRASNERLPNPSAPQVKPLGMITTRFCHLITRCLVVRLDYRFGKLTKLQ